MNLHDLLKILDPRQTSPDVPDLNITGIQEDSRRVQPGDLFVARAGLSTDGRQYITDAAGRGAVAIVSESPVADSPLPVVVVPNAAAASSILAMALRNFPSKNVKVLAVTGTNGKTTTTYILRELLKTIGIKCGMIGTVQIDDGAQITEAIMTTPSSIDVANLLGAMRDNGCGACAIETSSHALHQHRVDGVRFAAAAFTNLTGDHLDYHKTMDQYAASKAMLFERLPEDAVAVVNAADPWSVRLVRNCRAKIVRFGLEDGAEYVARDVSIAATGTRFALITPRGTSLVSTRLVGRHNVENALTAAAILMETFGMSPQQIADGLRNCTGAPGRLQPVDAGQPFGVFVDYAHTDDAMRNVLEAVRRLTDKKIHILFGCGGDRDNTKRPRMARVAEELADRLYITSDNPRTEEPASIIQQIVAGLSPAGLAKAVVEPDRRTAIRLAIAAAEPGDVVLLAGKGHENYQIIGRVKHHFDDVEEAMAALQSDESARKAG